MNQINQKAGKGSIQAGVIGNDLKIDNRKMGLGAWGCLALSIIAVVAGLTGVLIYITRETSSTLREAAPAIVTVAVVQATANAPIPVSMPQPVSSPLMDTSMSTDIPPELSQFVSNFLSLAVDLQIKAYSESNASYVEQVMAGAPLQQIQNNIAQFQMNGQFYVPYFDFSSSRYVDIRIINESATDATIEVDVCPMWGGKLYALDGSLLEDHQAQLFPQTVTIYLNTAQAWITDVVFYDSATFCY